MPSAVLGWPLVYLVSYSRSLHAFAAHLSAIPTVPPHPPLQPQTYQPFSHPSPPPLTTSHTPQPTTRHYHPLPPLLTPTPSPRPAHRLDHGSLYFTGIRRYVDLDCRFLKLGDDDCQLAARLRSLAGARSLPIVRIPTHGMDPYPFGWIPTHSKDPYP